MPADELAQLELLSELDALLARLARWDANRARLAAGRDLPGDGPPTRTADRGHARAMGSAAGRGIAGRHGNWQKRID